MDDTADADTESLPEVLQIGGDEESSQKLRELLQCPVCLEIALPPIFLCKRGHIVCNPCQDRTLFCPLCRDDYSNARSFVAEGLVESFTLKCRFRDQGCPEVLKGSTMVNHMKICEFRPVRCLYCHGEYIPFSGFFDHLKTKHKVDGDAKPIGSVKYNIPLTQVLENSLEKYCWAPSYFQCYGQTFMFHLHVACGSVCGWMSLLGVEAECAKYEALIEFYGSKFKVQWKGEVNNFREDPISNICKTGRGLILPYEIVRSNSVVNSLTHAIEWSYNIYIRERGQRLPQDPTPLTVAESGENGDSSAINTANATPSQTDKLKPGEEPSSASPLETSTVESILNLGSENSHGETDVRNAFERYWLTQTDLGELPTLEQLRQGLYNGLDLAEF